jgi:type VI secretion system protein VasD
VSGRRALLSAVGFAGAAALPGCGGKKPPPPPPPTFLALKLAASADVNPDGAGSPKPLRVRVLELSSPTALSQAAFFALDADPAKALGPELLGSEDVVLSPGQTTSIEHETKPGTKFVGVIGAYFAIESARWRAWAPVKPNLKNAFTAAFNAGGVALAEGGGA